MQKGKPQRFFVLVGLFFLLAFIQTSDAQVPPPPAQPADRVGVYAWGVDVSAYQTQTGGTIDRLNWAANYIGEIGTRTIRVALPGDIWQLGQMSDDLAQAAASPAYDRLLT